MINVENNHQGGRAGGYVLLSPVRVIIPREGPRENITPRMRHPQGVEHYSSVQEGIRYHSRLIAYCIYGGYDSVHLGNVYDHVQAWAY